MAVSSYLPDVAGGTVVASSFPSEVAANGALELLAASGVRPQDISVIARDDALAERLAGKRAWTPRRNTKGLLRMLGGRLPSALCRTHGAAIRDGAVVIVVAADGQPADTIAALFAQAKGDAIDQWWQAPASLFAPPEMGGPF